MIRTARRTRTPALTLLVAAVCVGMGLPAGPAAGTAEPGWGPPQEAPPMDGRPSVVAFADGTLVAVWNGYVEGAGDTVFRSSRAPAGSWTPAERLPMVDDTDAISIAPGPSGALYVSYSRTAGSETVYEVRAWRSDGVLGRVALSNSSGGYELSADAAGDIVAKRTVRTNGPVGFDYRFHHFDGSTWQRMPTIGAELGDIVVPGPWDSVWLASYDRSDNTLVVRRWLPGMTEWAVEWARDQSPRHPHDPLVAGMDFALGSSGHAVLAFYERPRGSDTVTIRVVRRRGDAGWTRAEVLQRVSLGPQQVVTGPVVAAAGHLAEVAWTTPAQWGTRRRVVRTASLDDDGRQVRRLAVTTTFRGFWDLSLDVAVRKDGDTLVTYLERHEDRRDLVGWLGPRVAPARTVLLEDLESAYEPVTAVLVPDLAAVVATPESGRLTSRTQES